MNKIKLSGCVTIEPTYSHECFGEKFYEFYLQVLRKSGNADTLKCIIPEVLKDGISQFDAIEVVGEVRTRNYGRADGTRGCEVFVFVTEVNEYSGEDYNKAFFDGFICKEPNYRETPLGRRICDVLIASNRERNDRSDYIPCIAWDRNARRTSEMPVATKVEIVGRLQSREYIKHFSDGTEEARVAYEVSVATIKECETDGE